nr:uncharacterized protein DDB_G0287625 isoform X2 [Crassostrea gigas]
MASFNINRICCLLLLVLVEWTVPQNVDFDGGDCGREFTVSQFDIFHLKADPNPVTSGGAASCIVKFRTDSSFSVYVQHLSVQDCTAKLFFYDNDNTQKYPVQTLTCLPTTPAGGTFTTRTGNLIVRLDKGSGSTKAYSFNLILTTIEGQVPNQVTDTAGGGVGTGAIIGIAVGVVAFLIIIIAVVCFFVCRQMAQQKEEKMRQLQPSVFTTASSRQPAPPSTTHPNTSGSHLTGRQASIRRSPRTKHFISQGFENRAFSETSNSTDMVESKVSYAIMSDTTVGGKSSIRMHNLQRGELNGSVRRDRSAPDKGLSDDARSSVKFDLRSDSKMGKINAPKSGKARNVHSTASFPSKTTSVQSSQNKENKPQTVSKPSENTVPKPKKSTTEGKNYFREYVNKGYDDDFNRSASLRKSKNRETSSSSHNSSNSYRHMNERHRDTRDVPDKAGRSRSRSESRRENERYRESESDDYYREQQRRSQSVDRSRRRSESRSRRRDDYYDDWESDSDYHSRDERGRSRSVERRSSRGPDRRPSSRHRTRDDYRNHYRSDDSL